MPPAFPPNDCDDIEVEAIAWPTPDELSNCVVADAPQPIYDCMPLPFPMPLPKSYTSTDSSSALA